MDTQDIEGLKKQNADLLLALRETYRAYVNVLEVGRDRIMDLGGDCDTVERMEENDPQLRKLRDLFATAAQSAPASAPGARTVVNADGSSSTVVSDYEAQLENDLAAIRDLFPTPQAGELHNLWSEACSDPGSVADYVKAQIAARAPAGNAGALTDEQYQEVLRPILSRKGMQRYLNGALIELDPSDFRAIIDCARSGNAAAVGAVGQDRQTELAKRLRIKAGMIQMCEQIALGSDPALMLEAANYIEATQPTQALPQQEERGDVDAGGLA